ncbi:MAG: hypothetical protein JRJ29_01550 [Deltaproteobacteria bacterium]|nr:hypothetical protein [Deltaproteobacteria bacterium]
MLVVTRCGRCRENFVIHFERTDGGKYAAGRTFPLDPGEGDGLAEEAYKFSNLTFAHYQGCPYCGSVHLVHCGRCGELTCQGAVLKLFKFKHWRCSWCNNSGLIRGHFNSLNGMSDLGSAKKAKKSKAKLKAK